MHPNTGELIDLDTAQNRDRFIQVKCESIADMKMKDRGSLQRSLLGESKRAAAKARAQFFADMAGGKARQK